MNHPPPNQFLHALFTKNNGLLKHCGPSSCILVLAPVSSSLNATDSDSGLVYGDNLTDEFMQSHILHISRLKNEVIDRGKARVYNTINGKTMVIKDDVIFPHRGFKGVQEVKVLHDALFWLDEPRSSPYLVYFLSRPLMGAPVSSMVLESSISLTKRKITTWSDLTRQYPAVGATLNHIYAMTCAELRDAFEDDNGGASDSPPLAVYRAIEGANSKRSRRTSSASIVPGPLNRTNTSLSFSDSSVLQYIRVRVDLAINSAIQAFQALPQSLLHSMGTSSHLDGTAIEALIESHILTALYDTVFPRLAEITRARDEEIAFATKQSKHVDISQLGAISSPDLRSRHARAIKRFQAFGKLHEPREKMASLLSTMNVLMRNSEKSSDDLIPLLVSVVLKSEVSNMCANILWIREFAFVDVDSGEIGFALSTLEAVLYHITSSIQALKKTSSANEQFFSAITAGNGILVRTLVELDCGLLHIRNLDDHTPHRLADGNLLKYFLSKDCTACNLSHLLMAHLNDEICDDIFAAVLKLDPDDRRHLLNEVDDIGQSIAHKIHEIPERLDQICDLLDWQLQDRQGNSSLQVLARIYDHPLYEMLVDKVLRTICYGSSATTFGTPDENMSSGRRKRLIRLEDHLDAKGNTLAHIVSGNTAMLAVFKYCVGDYNRLNDKGITPLLISIKFGRLNILNLLVQRTEIDFTARDSRGHAAIHYAARSSLALFNVCITAGFNLNERALGSGITPLHIASREGNIPVLQRLIELDVEELWDWRGFRAGDIVKNDSVRSIMDEWACRDREVKVLRGHIGDDCTVKYLIKSKSGGGVLRSAAEFTKLRTWMTTRYSASGVADLSLDIPEPCLFHSRPARSSLMAITERLDAFVQSLLEIENINQDPIVWEFLLSPTTNDKAITDSIDGIVERHKEELWNHEKALSSYDSAQMFFTHANQQVKLLAVEYSKFERKSRAMKDAQLHLSVAYGLIGIGLKSFDDFKACKYSSMLEAMTDALVPKEPSLLYTLIEEITSLEARITGISQSLSIPQAIIERMDSHISSIEILEKELAKTPRLQLNIPMLLDSQSRKKDTIKHTLIDLNIDLKHTGSELRYYETVLADNLSSFYSTHGKKAKKMICNFVKKQVQVERERLVGMQRAIAGIKHINGSE